MNKKDYMIEWHKINIEHERKYRRNNRKKTYERVMRWQKDNPEKTYKKLCKYREKNKQKTNARNLAIKHIRITNKTKCSICKVNLAKQRHHNDYNKPLDVLLVCFKCHTNIHYGGKLKL